tara:strand:+ start:2168 stop:3064 length:897 start_codon:yes stop_codon:yes gene_type:complete
MRLKRNLYKDVLGNIYYRKQIQGKRIILPVYTKNETTANKLHTALEYQALSEYYAPKPKETYESFSSLVNKYLKDPDVLSKWTDATKETTSYVLKSFIKNKTLPKNKETARGYQSRINACVNWGNSQGIKTEINLMEVNKKVGRLRVYNERELSIIMNEFQDDEFQSFIHFAYYTGARRGELTGIKPHHIEPTRMAVHGKSGKRYVKLNAQAREILASTEKLWDYKLDFITKKFKWNARRLDIKDARFHDLRRTFGLNLIKKGMPIYQLSKLLGHKSVKTTQDHYAPLLVDDIEDFTL